MCPGIPEPSCCPRCSGEPGWRRCAEGHESRLRQSARFKNRWSICGMLSGEVRPPAGTGELQGPAPGLFPLLLQNLDGVLCRRQGAGLPLAASCRAAYSPFRPLSRRFRRYGAGPCGILPFPAGRNLHIPGVSPLPLSHPGAPSASPDHSSKTRGGPASRPFAGDPLPQFCHARIRTSYRCCSCFQGTSIWYSLILLKSPFSLIPSISAVCLRLPPL